MKPSPLAFCSARSAGLLVLVVLLCAGCSTSNTVIYPVASQDNVERATRNGYDFLTTTSEGITTTVSLRAADARSMQMFVSIHNRGAGRGVAIAPASVAVQARSADGTTQSFEAYAPAEVPRMLADDARANQNRFVEMTNAINRIQGGADGGLLYGGQSSEDPSGAYGSRDDDSGESLNRLLLQEMILPEGNATNGLLFSPFTSDAESLEITIPVGDVRHTFRYELREEDKE